jgi:hypothetical protein
LEKNVVEEKTWEWSKNSMEETETVIGRYTDEGIEKK